MSRTVPAVGADAVWPRPVSGGDLPPVSGVVVALAGSAVAASYLGVRGGHLDGLDRRLTGLLTTPRPHRRDDVLAVATDLGSSFGLAGVATSLALLGRRRAAVEVAAAGGTAWLLAQAAKPALGRARPYELGEARRLVSPPAGTSWPSGHAALAAAMAVILARVGGRRVGAAAAVTAAAVGTSRIAVGVHHGTDVIAGAGVGVLSAALSDRVLTGLRRVVSREAAERRAV